jgi:two-component system, NarL family, response regulator DevR
MVMSREHKVTAVLIDDHQGTLSAVSEILRDEFEILAASSNSQIAFDLVATFSPDIAVLDIAMPERDGFEIARQMKECRLSTQIIFLTATEDEDYACAARDMGASYVVKRRMNNDLVTAVRETMDGKIFSSPVSPPHPR